MSHYKQLFFNANGGLFERPTAAFFFTMPAVVAMQRMALGMEVMTSRKKSFSDRHRHHHQKGEADNSRHGFLCLYHPILCPAASNA